MERILAEEDFVIPTVMDIQDSAHLVRLIEASHWYFLFFIRKSDFRKERH